MPTLQVRCWGFLSVGWLAFAWALPAVSFSGLHLPHPGSDGTVATVLVQVQALPRFPLLPGEFRWLLLWPELWSAPNS